MVDATPKPRRRWFKFSLRTMFVVVTVLAVCLGWLARELDWLQQRRAIIGHRLPKSDVSLELAQFHATFPRVPGGLWLFGERSYYRLLLQFRSKHGKADLTADEQASLEHIHRLFPEAGIWLKWEFDIPHGRAVSESPVYEVEKPRARQKTKPRTTT